MKNQDICLKNLISKKEFEMQNSMRNLTTKLMTDIAKWENWNVEEFNEYGTYGTRNPSTDSIYPDTVHPPHFYEICFQFIVNPDSSKAWRNWYETTNTQFAQQYAADVQQTSQNTDKNSEEIQQNLDSTTYWATLESQYIQQHANEFQQAASANNQAYLTQYQTHLNYFQSKINGVSSKATASRDKSMGNMGEHMSSFQNEKDKTFFKFHEACVLIITFQFNHEYSTGLRNKFTSGVSASVPGASIVAWYTNPNPDMKASDWSFESSGTVEDIMLGDWLPQADHYNGYWARFGKSQELTHFVTVKKIPGYHVQTMDIHICGRKDKIEKLSSMLDFSKLNAVIAK